MTNDGARVDAGLAGVKVLLVEDHEDTRLMLRAFLEHEGAIVSEADSAEGALVTVGAAPPDVVLTDVAFGHGTPDGLWLLERLRATPPLAGMAVVVVTGHAQRRAELQRCGFDDVMIKPIELGDLGDVVRGAMARRRALACG